jgi:NADPH:quinone reductase-like Zn-dependent oxidoreductase
LPGFLNIFLGAPTLLSVTIKTRAFFTGMEKCRSGASGTDSQLKGLKGLVMKAIVCTRYGTVEGLKLQEIPVPVPNKKQLLVQVHATAVNTSDTRIRSLQVSQPLKTILRLVVGWRKPRKPVLGMVFSGTVVEIGSSVADFTVGDEVFGCTSGINFGCHAEYVVVDAEGPVEHKPKLASHEMAAALIFGGTTALYFLGKLSVSRGRTILIYGASGAVGSAAVQIAKNLGFTVTASSSAANEQMVLDLGADTFIDYTKGISPYTGEPFAVIFDAVGKLDRSIVRQLLAKKGSYLTVGGLDVAKEKKEHLKQLAAWFDAGALKPVIDAIYPLESVQKAHLRVDSGHKRGNVVLSVGL